MQPRIAFLRHGADIPEQSFKQEARTENNVRPVPGQQSWFLGIAPELAKRLGNSLSERARPEFQGMGRSESAVVG
jgi:hypothetical protein